MEANNITTNNNIVTTNNNAGQVTRPGSTPPPPPPPPPVNAMVTKANDLFAQFQTIQDLEHKIQSAGQSIRHLNNSANIIDYLAHMDLLESLEKEASKLPNAEDRNRHYTTIIRVRNSLFPKLPTAQNITQGDAKAAVEHFEITKSFNHALESAKNSYKKFEEAKNSAQSANPSNGEMNIDLENAKSKFATDAALLSTLRVAKGDALTEFQKKDADEIQEHYTTNFPPTSGTQHQQVRVHTNPPPATPLSPRVEPPPLPPRPTTGQNPDPTPSVRSQNSGVSNITTTSTESTQSDVPPAGNPSGTENIPANQQNQTNESNNSNTDQGQNPAQDINQTEDRNRIIENNSIESTQNPVPTSTTPPNSSMEIDFTLPDSVDVSGLYDTSQYQQTLSPPTANRQQEFININPNQTPSIHSSDTARDSSNSNSSTTIQLADAHTSTELPAGNSINQTNVTETPPTDNNTELVNNSISNEDLIITETANPIFENMKKIGSAVGNFAHRAFSWLRGSSSNTSSSSNSDDNIHI